MTESRGHGAVDPTTTNAAGKLYLYRACGHSASRAVIADGALLLLGTEDWRVPIVALTLDERGVAFQLEVSKIPEVFRPPPEWRYNATPRLGLYEDGDERPAFMMTPEATATLDVVVRLLPEREDGRVRVR